MHRYLLLILITAALIVGLAIPALAEMKTNYSSQGNNVGAMIGTGYGGPIWGQSQFPRGSGNFFGTHSDSKWNVDSDDTRINWGVNVARDSDGDGVSDDTVYNQHRGAHIYGCNSALESLEQLQQLYDSGNNMFEAASRLEVNRVYSSLDKVDLADWPPEFREGRSASGDPILKGAETICIRFGDAFHEIGAASGVSMEYQFYFLNYGESNNMVYGHVFIRNMSEYLKWNPVSSFRNRLSATPDGQTWHGWQLHFAMTRMRIGGSDEGWMFYSPKGIMGLADKNNHEDSFVGGTPAMIAHIMLRPPSFKGQTMELSNACAHGWSSEYGFGGSKDMLEGGINPGKSYIYGLGESFGTPYYPDLISPWTEEQAYGYPGVQKPGDMRYDQWMWGDRNENNTYTFWSEINDFAPRDTASADFALMFVMPPAGEWVMPKSVLTEVDNQEVQDHFEPVLDYANVAELVYGGGHILPETQSSPPMTIIPGDRSVSITWNDINFQTPDAYYGFLQDHPELDPQGRYVEYDMEGYRLYRSFVGPSDSHSELIFECSKSTNDLSFYYVDSYADDQPLYRLANGKKVWYALVPYDKNYDTTTGDEYSLPELTSGKVWNRPGQNLYTVIPRSDASNYNPAGVSEGGITFVPHSSTEVTPGTSAELAGDGSGKLTEPPVYMAPAVNNMRVVPVNSEKIMQDKTVTLLCHDVDWWYGGCNRSAGTSMLKIVDGSLEGMEAGPLKGAGASDQTLYLNGPMEDDGISYAVEATFQKLDSNRFYKKLYYDIDTGGYTGASVRPKQGGCGGRSVGGNPGAASYCRAGVYTVTWVDAGDGNLTVEISESLHGRQVPYTEYLDDLDATGWGFWTDNSGGFFNYYFNYFRRRTPVADREKTQDQYLASDRTDDFCLWVNGLPWYVSGLTSMPTPGTVWTITNCYGSWNDDMTLFTQIPDMPWVGDRWTININGMSQDVEDADMSLISVVPNPYLASSFLDLSPNSRRIEFVNLPDQCTVRIYSLGGNLVNVLNHIGVNRHGWGNYQDFDRLDTSSQPRELTGYDNHGGTEAWNLRNRFGQTVASGLYFYVVTDSRGKTHTGKFYIVN
jgi:hypothetical protein